MKRISILLILALSLINVLAQQRVKLDINQTIKIASDSSLTAFINQNMYLAGYWEFKSYKAERLPTLSLDLSPANYYSDIVTRYDSESDLDVFREQQTFSASGGLMLEQNFDLTGGTFYVESELGYLNNFGGEDQFSSVPIRIGYSQDLIGYNAFRWERKIEPIKFEKVKREFIYNTATIAEDAVTYFFSLAMAQAEYNLALNNVANSDTIYKIGVKRHSIAAISQEDLLTLELECINSHNSLENAKVELRRANFALVTYLNLDKNIEIEVILPEHPKPVIIPSDIALSRAMENNPTYMSNQISILEAERDLNYAKVESYINASVNLSMGFNQVGSGFSNVYKDLMRQDIVSLNIQIPLVDWGVRKGQLNMAKNNLNVTKISARQEEVSIEQDVVITVSEFIIQQKLINSAERALNIASAATALSQQRFITGKTDVNSYILAQDREQTAQRNYISAIQNYWISYYKIRRLTLYDFVSNSSLIDDLSIFNAILE